MFNPHIYTSLSKENPRIAKSHTLEFEQWHKTATLEEKEARSLALIETAIRKVVEQYGKDAKIVVSSSFGIDSIVTLHLVLRVTQKLGIPLQVVWNNTLNEYPQTRKYAKELTELWNLDLIEATPNTTIKKIYEKHGVETLFKRKGDRAGEKPVVERCCGALKHAPMKKAIKEHGWHLMFNGVRAGESRQRWMSGRRDSDFYYSTSEWNLFTVRPILWWTAMSDSFNYGNNRQEDIWEYVRKYEIPYNPIYDLNLVMDDRYVGESLIVKREEAESLVEQGLKVFMPRTGCMACSIPIRRGYLRYLREVFPKVYHSMLFQLGFAKVLMMEMPEEQRQSLFDEMSSFGVIDKQTQEAIIEKLEEVLEIRPCIFDDIGLDKRHGQQKSVEEIKKKTSSESTIGGAGSFMSTERRNE